MYGPLITIIYLLGFFSPMSFRREALERWDAISRGNPAVSIMVAIMVVLLIADAFLFLVPGLDAFRDSLHGDSDTYFMDFFSSLVDSMNDPYGNLRGETGVIYPALITAFYALVGNAVSGYVPDPSDAFSYREVQEPVMVLLVITALSLYAVHMFCMRAERKGGLGHWMSELLFLCVLLSSPVMYAVVRGNSMIMCAVFCALFVLGYRSESKWIRWGSYICLGIAAGIKIAPAVLAFLILRERDWRGFAECAAVVAVLFIGPFALTDGGLSDLTDNLLSYSDDRNDGTIVTANDYVYAILHRFASEGVQSAVSIAVTASVIILFGAMILFDRELDQWKVLMLMFGAMILCFGNGIRYNFCYIIVPMVYFASERRELSKINAVSAVCFAVIFMLYPPEPFLKSLALIAVLAMISWESLPKAWDGIRKAAAERRVLHDRSA